MEGRLHGNRLRGPEIRYLSEREFVLGPASTLRRIGRLSTVEEEIEEGGQ